MAGINSSPVGCECEENGKVATVNEELTAIKAAMDNADFTTARDLSDQYVRANPGEFNDLEAIANDAAAAADKGQEESAALAAIVQTVEALRTAGLEAMQYRAEAFHLARWEAQNVNGSSEPRVRNVSEPQKRSRK